MDVLILGGVLGVLVLQGFILIAISVLHGEIQEVKRTRYYSAKQRSARKHENQRQKKTQTYFRRRRKTKLPPEADDKELVISHNIG